jgi:uncharacterized protein (TIGR02145 family)
MTVACKKPASDTDKPDPIPTSVKDCDGNEYAVKLFGNTLWMMKNLKVTRYDTQSQHSGDTIIEVQNNPIVNIDMPYFKDVKNFTDTPYTDNLTSQIRNSFGFLYNWSAAVGATTNGASGGDFVQGICPNGWRLPTLKDFDSLCYYLGGKAVAGEKLKSISGWYTITGSGTNESEMNCYPAGLSAGSFVSFVGQQTMFWSSTSITNLQAGVLKLFYDQEAAELIYVNKIQANSVRCVKDL